MYLTSMTIKNFRCYREETSISFDKFTTLVGRNDAGKSAVLEALGVFFGQVELEKDDFTIGSTGDIEITCHFKEMPLQITLDTDAPTSFEAEYLINSEDGLTVTKRYLRAASPAQSGTWLKCQHPAAANYNDLLKLKNTELKARAQSLGVNVEGIDTRKNPPLRRAIWEHATDLQITEMELLVEKGKGNEDVGDAAKIGKKIAEVLPVFALFKSDRASSDQDTEAQDPLNSAVKEALAQQQTELDAIYAQVCEQVKKIADKTVEKLREMSPELARELNPIVVSKPLDKQFKVSLTGDEGIPINKRGSGIRRLILLNFFRAKAEDRIQQASSNGIIYAVEEPETSQHPHNQRLLLRAFEEIASSQQAQILLTTHTPMMASLVNKNGLRFIPHTERPTSIDRATVINWQDIVRELGILPDSLVRLYVGIEGVNDINFLVNTCKILRQRHPELVDLATAEQNGEVVFFQTGGSNLKHWLDQSRLQHLNRNFYHVIDQDVGDKAIQNQASANRLNAMANCEAVITQLREMENYIHPDAIRAFVSTSQNIDRAFPAFGANDDVPTIIASTLRDIAQPDAPWAYLSERAQREKISNCKGWLNKEVTALMTPEMLDQTDPHQEVLGWMRRMTQIYNEFGTTTQQAEAA